MSENDIHSPAHDEGTESIGRASTSRSSPLQRHAPPTTQPGPQRPVPRTTSPSLGSPTSSAVAHIIADLGHPRHSPVQAASPHTRRLAGSNLRVNDRGESRYHGPTSASFSAPDHLTGGPRGNDDAGQNTSESNGLATIADLSSDASPRMSIDPTLLKDRLTSLAARERQLELMNAVTGKLDFDGVDPELALHLFNLHWNRQHHAYLVTYRPLFMQDMAAPPGKAKYFSKLLFHAILFGAAKFSDRIDLVRTDINDPSTAGQQFLERVQQLLPEALIKSRITTVQALLLLACTHYARGSESAAWLHSGLAFRMAIDLGMNKDSIELVASGKMSLEELELRRRVIWAAYVIDKNHSLYQGRQASMERRNLYVPIEFYDHFEETEFWTPVAYRRPASDAESHIPARSNSTVPAGYTGPIYSVSTFTELCRLTVIMERIIKVFYAIDSGTRSDALQTDQLKEIRSELAAWRSSLPTHLGIEAAWSSDRSSSHRSRTRPPNLISLHALYYALTILLNRPFLPHGHLRSDDPSTNRSAWKACVDAASSISSLMSLYRQTVSMKGAPQLISYINFCAAGIHVRLAAQLQQRPASGTTQEAANVAASSRKHELKALRQCLQDFEENQDPNPGVVKAKSVIRTMAERAGILDLLQTGNDDGSLSPVGRNTSPPDADVSDRSGAAKDTGVANKATTHDASADPKAPSAAAAGPLERLNATETSAVGVTPPYEIDFESILASFDHFEPAAGTATDNLFAGSANAATDSDILFGFLRDYDPPTDSASGFLQ